MINAVLVQSRKPVFNQNIFNSSALFNSSTTLVKDSGDGILEVSTYTGYVRAFGGSLHLSNNNLYDKLVVSLGTALQTQVMKSGRYILSFEILHNVNPEQRFKNKLTIIVFKNGVRYEEILCTIQSDDTDETSGSVHPAGVWATYTQLMTLNNLDNVDFKLEYEAETSPSSRGDIWVDAFKLELDDKFLTGPTIYSLPNADI